MSKVHVLAALMISGMAVACGSGSQSSQTKSMNDYEGDFVTTDYARRGEGYDWSVVSIRATSDTSADVRVRSRADRKKSTCAFQSPARLSSTGDTLVVTYGDQQIYLTAEADTLSISAQDETLLHYFCSGGATLAGDYVKLHEPLDETQLKPNFDGMRLTYPGSDIAYTIAMQDKTLRIIPEGLTVVQDTLVHDLTGYTVANIEIGDLNTDSYPELLVYLVSDGSGSYGSLIGYSPNNGKSLSQVYLPELADTPEYAKDYIGHDEMAIVENTFCRRFPIGDPNAPLAERSGKMRQIQYRMVDGEAGRTLKIDQVLEF